MENPTVLDSSANKNLVRPKTWLTESILVTIFCCLPIGIIGIINAAEVNTKWAVGDYKGAVESARRARRWVLIGFAIGLIILASLLAVNVYLYMKYNQNY